MVFMGGRGGENKRLYVHSCSRNGKKNIFQAMTGCLVHFPIGMGNYHNISNRKMTLASERGETSYNSDNYPIQGVHCLKGLRMMNTLWPHNRIQDFLSKKIKDIHGVLKRILV